MVDLFAEMAWAGATSHNPFGYSLIVTSDAGLFEPSDDYGRPLAMVVPVGYRRACGTLQTLDDVVAFYWREPDRWWRRLGAVDVLGEQDIDWTRTTREPLHLVPHPLAWLRHDGPAACILDWSVDPRVYFDDHPGIVCTTPGTERRLRFRLEDAWRPRFAISTMAGCRDGA